MALASAAVLVLGGCASSANLAPTASALAPASLGLGTNKSPAVVTPLSSDWWRAFGDPQLSALVERALTGSPGLKVAQARLQRAQAAVSAAQGAEGPQVGATADLMRERFSANSIYPPPLGGSTRTLATAQISGSWEIDFFGRNRAAIEAAVGGDRAAQAELHAARARLASDVARAYLQLARLTELRAVASAALAQREATLSLIRQRVQGGLDTNVELRQGEAALPDARQQIESIDEQRSLTRHRLAALTAQAPQALEGLTPQLLALHGQALPAAIPADLLGRRADITAARWRVEAATSEVAGAQALFYPNVNLTAFIGLSSIGLDRLTSSDSRQYGAGPALRLPIFESGRLRANLRGKAAELDLAIESYNAAIVDAVREAADSIASLQSIGRQQAEQALAQRSADSAYDLALQRYRAGLSTYLVVLNAESVVLNQRRLAVDLQARTMDTQITLIRALGGGYAAEANGLWPSAPPPARPVSARSNPPSSL